MTTSKEETLQRLKTVEESLYRIAHDHEKTDLLLKGIHEDQKKAESCRAALRESVLDLKTIIVEMREEASKERAAMSTQLTFRTKPGTLVKVAGAVVTAVLGYFATKSPEAAAVAGEITKVLQ
jgi:hypothetical protein